MSRAKQCHRSWFPILLIVSVGLVSSGCDAINGGVGSPCLEKEECSQGLCLQENRYGDETGWKDGYCTEQCTYTCSSGRCVALSDGSYCLKSCQQPLDCRRGYICHPLQNVCLPDCLGNWPCGGEFVCGQEGICLDPTSPEDGGVPGLPDDQPIGAPCQTEANCASQYCIRETATPSGMAWKNGMCSSECGSCPQGSHCVNLETTSVCLPNCIDNTSCRDGYVCNWQVSACTPDCRLGFECGPLLRCNGRGICTSGSGSGW